MAGIGCAFVVLTTATKAEEAAPPNIVLVFLDNFGWAEPGFTGGGHIRGAATPRMDQATLEGLRLTHFNVEVQYTPSRSAIMTGRYTILSEVEKLETTLQGATRVEQSPAHLHHAAVLSLVGRPPGTG